MGGEKAGIKAKEMHIMGSPPRGRGKDLAKSARWKGAGITPAWAGKSIPFAQHFAAVEDHPRVGGEKFTFLLF